MPHVRLFVLGPPRIECAGVPVTIDRRKALALLAYLEVTKQRHTRDSLAALLWPDDDQTTARTALRRTLAAITSAIGSQWFDIDREHIGLVPHPNWTSDLADFRAALQAVRQTSDPRFPPFVETIKGLEEAVAHHKGDFLSGFTLRDSPTFDEWQFFQADELRRELADALEQLARGHQSLGSWPAALAAARRWLALDQLHEPAHRLLMELYAQAGQRGNALRQFQICARTLQQEVSGEPEAETVQLYERIREGWTGKNDLVEPRFTLHSWTIQEDAPARELDLPLTSLEPQTSLVGRETERAMIARFLADPACRLVTLIGPGGIGKTRLALEMAHEQHSFFPDGAHFISLVSIPPDGCLFCAISHALGITLYAPHSPKMQLFAALQHQKALLVLDNFEHLVDAAGLLSELLAHAPQVKLLVTSRERLRLSREWTLELGGLDVPSQDDATDAEECSAVQLFLQTARRARADFVITPENRPDIVHICRVVEGMPLGIELAAAWVRMLSCAEIAREIEQNLDFLTSSLRDVPERHQSIRAAFEHSWRLLAEIEQTAFRQLSVFQCGFDRAAASEVAGATLPTLVALADKSLLRRRSDGRYEVQELLRQYAAEKLCALPDDAFEVYQRHSRYYVDLLERFAQTPLPGGRRHTLATIGPELENVRSAWDWAVRNRDVEALQRSAPGLCLLYESIGWFGGSSDALRQALAVFDATHPQDKKHREVRRTMLLLLSSSTAAMGHFTEAERLIEQALALHHEDDDLAERAVIYDRMGKIYSYIGKLESSLDALKAALTIRKTLPNRAGAAKTMSLIAYNLAEMGRYREARPIIAETIELCGQDDGKDIASAFNNLAYANYLMGSYDHARSLIERALSIWQESDQWFGVTVAQMNLGLTSIAQQSWEEAHHLFYQILQTAQEMQLAPVGLDAIVGFALLLLHEEEHERAAELLALALNHPASWHETRTRATRLMGSLQVTLPSSILDVARERGRTRSYEQVATELLVSRPMSVS